MSVKNFEFKAKLLWDGESGGKISIGKFPDLMLDIPVEFGGRGRHPCPDELFLSSVAGCLLTTFLYFRRRLGFDLYDLNISIKGKLTSQLDGYRMNSIKASMHVTTKKSYEAKARRCIELTKKHCHITRMLEPVVRVEISEKIIGRK